MFEPLFNKVFLYAGVTDACNEATMCDKNNITLIASGMNGGKKYLILPE